MRFGVRAAARRTLFACFLVGEMAGAQAPPQEQNQAPPQEQNQAPPQEQNQAPPQEQNQAPPASDAVVQRNSLETGAPYAGFQFETGVGVAFPSGALGGGLGDVSNAATFKIPIDINLGYRFSRNWALGMYWGLDPVWANNDFIPCAPAATCGGFGMRIGLHAQYHFAPTRAVDPWLSAGVGWELLSVSETTERSTGEEFTRSESVNGPTLLEARVGLDFGSTRQLRYGPYVGLTWGSYWTLVANCDLCRPKQSSVSLVERGTHQWLQVGFQGRMTLTP